jgi:hypothetical protein
MAYESYEDYDARIRKQLEASGAGVQNNNGGINLQRIREYNESQTPAYQEAERKRREAEESLAKQRDSVINEAKQFRGGLQEYKNSRYGDVANTARDQLDQTLRQIRRNANARGLLFSGMRTGAEANARTKMASMLAQQRAEINKESDDLAQSKDTVAANIGLSGYENAIKRASDLYELESTNQARRRAALGQLGEGVGYGFGAYYSQKKPSGLIGNSTGQSYGDYSGYV